MTAVELSAIERSNVERPTPDVQSKRYLLCRWSHRSIETGPPPTLTRSYPLTSLRTRCSTNWEQSLFRRAAAVTRVKERPGFPTNTRAACAPQNYPKTPMSEVSDQSRAAALARARSSQAARKAFISSRSITIRLATPLYFFVVPVTVRLTAPWCTRP